MRLIILSLLVPFIVNATCLPQNDLNIPPFEGRSVATGISRATFNAAIDELEDVYGPIFYNARCPLIILRSWQDGTVNAQAWQQGGLCFVQMFGGLARYPEMGKRTFQLVLCHEIGHHIGGPPYYSGERLSVEGQSDYFATLDCMRRIGVNPSIASLNMATILSQLNNEVTPSRSTRATERVTRTIQSHPRAQCRLDTYDAAYDGQSRPRCWYAGR